MSRFSVSGSSRSTSHMRRWRAFSGSSTSTDSGVCSRCARGIRDRCVCVCVRQHIVQLCWHLIEPAVASNQLRLLAALVGLHRNWFMMIVHLNRDRDLLSVMRTPHQIANTPGFRRWRLWMLDAGRRRVFPSELYPRSSRAFDFDQGERLSNASVHVSTFVSFSINGRARGSVYIQSAFHLHHPWLRLPPPPVRSKRVPSPFP